MAGIWKFMPVLLLSMAYSAALTQALGLVAVAVAAVAAVTAVAVMALTVAAATGHLVITTARRGLRAMDPRELGMVAREHKADTVGAQAEGLEEPVVPSPVR
jgi:hypothetical protein